MTKLCLGAAHYKLTVRQNIASYQGQTYLETYVL